MSLYSAPLSIVPIFDASLFSTSIGSVQSGTSGTTLTYPTAQGAESWTNGIRTTTIDNSGILIQNNPGILTAIGFNANGIAYNDGFTTSTLTWPNFFVKQAAVAALSQASNSTTLNINKTLQIQNGETTLPPTSFISLDASGNLLRMNLCQDGTTANYGTSGYVLKSGGASGTLTWGVGSSDISLNSVLTNGNTTTNSATFQSGTDTNVINGNQVVLSSTVLGIAKSITLDNYTGYSPNIQILSAATGNSVSSTLNQSSLTFTFGTPPFFSYVGISNVGTGLNLKTNGTLTFQDLTGSTGYVLTYNSSGNAVWAPAGSGGTTIQAGETTVGAMTSAVTGTVTYATAFATKPKIVLTMNLNGTGTTIIPVAVSSNTVNVGTGTYTGFTWIAGTTSSTATISWYATL